MHVLCQWDTRINLVRNMNINIMKRAACLDDYRRIYPADKKLLFVYSLNEALPFMQSYQLTAINLFALHSRGHLVMSQQEASAAI